MGGAETFLYRFLTYDISKRQQYLVVSLGGSDYYSSHLKRKNIRVVNLNVSFNFLFIFRLIKLLLLLKKSKISAIVGWMHHGNLLAYIIKLIINKNALLIWNVRQSLYALNFERAATQLVIKINRSISSRVDYIVYNSSISRIQHENYGFNSYKGVVINNGIDLTYFSPVTLKHHSFNKVPNIPKGCLVIGHIARYHKMKNHELFIKSVLSNVKQNRNIHVLMIGTDVEYTNSKIASLIPVDYINNFHLLGPKTDVRPFLQIMNIFCSSSSWGESFQNVIAEAMAMEIPCISTDVGEAREIIGNVGIVVPPNNEELLTNAINFMSSKSNFELRYLGKLARDRILERYNMEYCYEKLKYLYSGVQQIK